MIFIYPASVSETCDKRIVPAVCKSIERFFLLQLQDAISSGELSFYRKWEGNKYGPLLMESIIKPSNTKMLLEGFNDERTQVEQDKLDFQKKKWDEEKKYREQKDELDRKDREKRAEANTFSYKSSGNSGREQIHPSSSSGKDQAYDEKGACLYSERKTDRQGQANPQKRKRA
jgi:hypothetical protein